MLVNIYTLSFSVEIDSSVTCMHPPRSDSGFFSSTERVLVDRLALTRSHLGSFEIHQSKHADEHSPLVMRAAHAARALALRNRDGLVLVESQLAPKFGLEILCLPRGKVISQKKKSTAFAFLSKLNKDQRRQYYIHLYHLFRMRA